MMKDHQIIESSCPSCGEAMTGAAGVESDDAPTPGDISVCLYCRALLVFGNDLKLRMPTDAELIEMAGNKQMIAIVNAIGAADVTPPHRGQADE